MANSGGLLQMVTSGKQDIYLTINPEITFFKKVYKRHVNFSIELREIYPLQDIDYNNIISFSINNTDALYRCYIEIELPKINNSDKYITSEYYLQCKQNKINNLKLIINKWKSYYDNLKNYVDIEIQLYRSLYNLLIIDNITIDIIKNTVIKFNYKHKTLKDTFKNNIESDILDLIDISTYILNINKFISNTENNSVYILKDDIIKNINNIYKNMTNYLSYYNKKYNYYNKFLNDINNDNKIKYSYSDYLGHNFFQYFSLELGGIEIQKYSNHILHINQLHRIKNDYMDNYFEMIGHIKKLNEYNNIDKNNNKIIVPLIFWFNINSGSSLPLVALKYSNITINAKINDITKIVCFEDYENLFDEICDINIDNMNNYDYKLDTNFIIENKLLYSSYFYNVEYKFINYKCKYINYTLLKLRYNNLTDNNIYYILHNFGIKYDLSQILNINPNYDIKNMQDIDFYVINKIQWINFMLNINKIDIDIISKFDFYYPYIDYNQYYNLIGQPNIKLIGEFIYFDENERIKYANSKLEYIVEVYDENLYNFNKYDFDCEFSFTNPCKELIWTLQPQIYYDGINLYGKNYELLYDIKKFFKNNIIENQKMSFEQFDVLLNKIDNNYYNYVTSYKYLNNILPNGVYYHSFCLYPEESQPSGTINMRKIKSKLYHLTLNKKFIDEYNEFLSIIYNNINIDKSSFALRFISKSYNIFIVDKGYGYLMFNTK